MDYADSILDLVGNTPLVRLRHVAPQDGPLVLAKVEYLNPGGSVKSIRYPTLMGSAVLS